MTEALLKHIRESGEVFIIQNDILTEREKHLMLHTTL